MRIIKELPHPECRITLFAWNNRYIIKLEQSLLEQTFKVNQLDIDSEDEVIRLLDEAFISDCLKRFREMAGSLAKARQRIA